MSDIKNIRFNSTYDLVLGEDVEQGEVGIKSKLINVTTELLNKILSDNYRNYIGKTPQNQVFFTCEYFVVKQNSL